MSNQKRNNGLIWCSSDYSHPGHRRKENEDAVYNDARSRIWCVADGMGGHQHGGLASKLLVETMASMPVCSSLDLRVKEAQQRLFILNQALFAKGREISSDSSGKREIVGCTFVILMSDGVYNTCLWAGDSRLYLLRGSDLFQVTDDHTVISDLLSRGVISKEESENHPQSHVVTRALGAAESIQLEKKTFLAKDGDRYLLCSDGIYNELMPTDIAAALALDESNQSCRCIVDKVLKTDAADNLTACVVNASSATAYLL